YAQGGASDPSYGYILGSDSYAEVMVGRFSAESDPDVMTQVQRVLNYEMYPDPSGLWYDRGVVVGSNQGPGDDGEMDWEHALNMRNDLVNFTYGNVSELYDGTHPGTGDAPGDPSSTDLFNLFQSGIGIMTYTGHGSSTACTTTGLANGDVQNMTNTNMLPFIWAVACVNGEFDMPGGPCFAETFLRATHNGAPTGAIATFMSSINQSWNPPMDAQDEMVDILVQSDSSNLKFTFGGLSVSGCMHMNDQYGLSGVEMTDTWHIFGDPTLQVRTATPQLMSVSHPSSMPVGLTSLTVNCNYNGGLVALTMNGQVLATGAVSGGAATLSFAPVGMPDTIFVTVTGFNQIPYLGQVLVIPASGPYVIYQSSTAKDLAGNNDGLVDFAETIDVDLTLHNVGLADAFNVSAVLSTSDSYVTILNNTVNAGNLLSNTSATLVNAFQYQVAADVPDQHMVFFSVDATDGNGGSWTSSFSQLIQAPALAGGILSIDDATGGDADGYLEAGESATVTIRCHNNGHSDAPLSSASISTFSNFLTLTSPLFNAGTIGKQQYVDATFQVSMLNNVALGTSYDITLQLNSGAYLASKTYVATAGIILEDFESNDFSAFNWLNGAVFPWITTSYQPFEGAYCATNGNVSDNESSELLISLTALADDSVTFWYRMSSEQDWDYLRFYIDGVEQGAWSGTGPWMYTGFPLGTGMHVLKFIYEKDSYLSAGMDCAWIDNVRLPVGSQVTGTAQMIRKDGLAIWPNPSEGIFNVSIEGMKDSDLHWSICDVQGKQLRSGNTRAQQGSSSFALETNGLATGMYLLTLESGSTRRIAKIQVR
ncbi:MAG: T9SS type A sorting domain-containing protein, partial [Bacteroidia bacterium]|nr:T9SS type A sorting domain-containing protein [Bacteroidia bacterium]